MLRIVTIFLIALSFPGLANDYQRFEQNGKVGLKDENGAIVLPASFDALGWSDGNFSVIGQITGYRQNNKWGLVNLKKEFITKANFSSLTWPGGDRVIVSKHINSFTIKFGCLDLQGKQTVPFMYDAIDLHDLRAIVMVKNGKQYEYGLIDLNDRSVVPMRYKKITPIGTQRYAVENFSNKTAICNEEGKWIMDFVIDNISEFHHDLAIIHQGWKQGVIDRNGEIKIQPEYRMIHIIAPDQLTVRKADEWKILDENANDIQVLDVDELHYNNDGFYRVTLDGKNGLVDEQFRMKWPVEYDFVGPIENKQAVVKKDKKFGVLRLDQSVVLPIEFDTLCLQKNFVRIMRRTGGRSQWEVYDTFGVRKTNSSYEFIDRYNGKFFPVKNRGYFGAVDRYGKERIACVYDSLLEMNDSLMVVRFKEHYGIITLDDQWRVGPQKERITLLSDNHYLIKQDTLTYLKAINGSTLYFTEHPLRIFDNYLLERLPDGTEKEISFQGLITRRQEPVEFRAEQVFKESEGLIGIQRDGKFGFVDNRGRLRIANRYEGIGEFHDGLAPIRLLGKWGYINKADEIEIQPTYDISRNFDQHVAQVSRKGKFGLINTKGKELLELQYDSISKLTDGNFLLIRNNLMGMADPMGRLLIEPRFDELQSIPGGVIVRRGKFYGLLTHEGVSVLPLQYSILDYQPARKEFLVKKDSFWETIDLGNR
jgi:WG containing repeat